MERVTLWGRGQGRRSGAGGAYRRPCPLLPSARCGGRSVNLNAAFTAQCVSRQRPASLISPSLPLGCRSTYRRRSSWTDCVFWRGFFFLVCCLGPRKVPNAERSTRCPGANLEVDRSTWVQFKVSRRERRCVDMLKLLGTDVMMGGFFLGETKINSSHSFCFIASLRMDWMRAGHQLPNNGSLLF